MQMCDICGVRLIGKTESYRTHIYTSHGGLLPKTSKAGLESHARAVPETPTRSRAENVALVETRLAAYLIGPECETGCRCARCWMRFQANWVAQEAA